MKHFIVEIQYKAPIEVVSQTTPKHREFLQNGYERGWLLLSGPQNPKVGGIVVCKAPSLAEIQAYFAQDPYALAGLSEYKFTEFEPVKYAPLAEAWVKE